WENDSWGYHNTDGGFFHCSREGRPYGPPFTTGDTIGCCLNFRDDKVFFTKNGERIASENLLEGLKGTLYPSIGMSSSGAIIKANFGHSEFQYRLEEYQNDIFPIYSDDDFVEDMSIDLDYDDMELSEEESKVPPTAITEKERTYPSSTSKAINITSRNQDKMFAEFISAIMQFRTKDFISRPNIVFKNERAIDAGGVFNDTMYRILEIFMSLENPEYGGDGHLFSGDHSKLISSTAPMDLIDELNVFGDVLFLAIIYDAPFPIDLDIVLFKYCLKLDSTISLDDLKRFNEPMYNLAREVSNASVSVNLSTIDGFDQWAEENEISPIQKHMYARSRENLRKLSKKICKDVLINSRINQFDTICKKLNRFGFLDVLKAKKITIEQVNDHLYREVMTAEDVIRKLKFGDTLNNNQIKVQGWLIDWLREQEKTNLRQFCLLISAYPCPRQELKVSFKSKSYRGARDLHITPEFHTCFQELTLSPNFTSKQEFYNVMNVQLDQGIHDNRFSIA
ncbi:14508_t:CDS:2, partial [Acaulospora morrowiae]